MNIFRKIKPKSKESSEKEDKLFLEPTSAKDVYLKKEQFSATAEHFMNTQPSFVLKGPIFIIFIVIFAAIIYSFFAKVQTKVSTPVTVTGEEYLVQSPVLGSVSSIYISNGESVKEQQSIISILSEGMLVTQSNIHEVLTDLQNMESRFKLITYAIKQIESHANYYGKRNSNFSVNISSEVDFSTNDGLLNADNVNVSEQKWRQSEYYNIVERLKIKMKNLWTEYYRTRKLLSKQEQIYEEDKELFEKDVITSYQLASSHEKYLNLQASASNILNTFKIDIFEIVEQLMEQRTSVYEKYRNIKLELDETQISEENIIIKDKLVIVNAKYPGEVVNINVKSYEYVARGMGLLTIIRSDLPDYGEMYIPDSDIGKVAPGQKVTIKFDAFPYQEYGVQIGTLVNISADPISTGSGISYKAKMTFEKVNPKINLRYGMRGSAEISTGEKRLIETIFAPITAVFDYFKGADKK